MTTSRHSLGWRVQRSSRHVFVHALESLLLLAFFHNFCLCVLHVAISMLPSEESSHRMSVSSSQGRRWYGANVMSWECILTGASISASLKSQTHVGKKQPTLQNDPASWARRCLLWACQASKGLPVRRVRLEIVCRQTSNNMKPDEKGVICP